MVLMETLFDVFSAAIGAIVGVIFAFFLNRKSRNKMANQLVVSRQALDKIKMENQNLLEQIHDKEDMILKMQMQMLAEPATETTKTKSNKRKK